MIEDNTSLKQSIFFQRYVINFCLLPISEGSPVTVEFSLHIETWPITYLFISFV
jgi:hypothetical protein